MFNVMYVLTPFSKLDYDRQLSNTEVIPCRLTCYHPFARVSGDWFNLSVPEPKYLQLNIN